MKTKTTTWANRELNASPITREQVWAEVKEWCEATTREERREERQDVLYFALCRLGHLTGLSLPLIGCGDTVAKIEGRLLVWRDIFASFGLPFDVAYLVNGSNHEKPYKVAAALRLAHRANGYPEHQPLRVVSPRTKQKQERKGEH